MAGLPPDILAQLMGPASAQGAGLPPDMAEAVGPPPPGALHAGSAAEGDPEEFYRQALDALELGIKSDTDEVRINTALQVFTKIQGLLAESQKGQDAMLGGKLDPSTMRRLSAPEQSF